MEVTAPAHTGCPIFVRHFGKDAMRFVNGRSGRHAAAGRNARVVTPGSVRAGDKVSVQRGPPLW